MKWSWDSKVIEEPKLSENELRKLQKKIEDASEFWRPIAELTFDHAVNPRVVDYVYITPEDEEERGKSA